MERQITIRIILLSPPAGVDFGLQEGSGNNYKTILKQRSGNTDLSFEFNIVVKKNKAGILSLAGPYVQGPPTERFIYIDIGTAAGQLNSIWSRRLKIPLKQISPEMIEQVATDPSLLLETKVPGTAKDGGPNCATVKPFDGWSIVSK